ncbi:maleylpyruvate isomerase family mycothiol-dependent enzyme [Streptomyces sp. NBC_01525]|uniref:maleylpyruvate isomerase family mycothiol-dependent enzyme n=1 Tax=Streptomyces sp. NBC_01525 TaxID=2903893 RepID=UPI00386C3346
MTGPQIPAATDVVLRAERDTLVPRLRTLPEADLKRPTVCSAWTVRDIVAHCGAALTGLAAGPAYRASHEQNQRDVEERRSWPLKQVIDEFDQGLADAGPAIRAAGGAKDLAALGTWIHGGDVREAIGLDDPYHSRGHQAALTLLSRCERVVRTPLVEIQLPTRRLTLGSALPGRPTARLTADVPDVLRLYTGRPVAPDRYQLSGATPEELVSAEW